MTLETERATMRSPCRRPTARDERPFGESRPPGADSLAPPRGDVEGIHSIIEGSSVRAIAKRLAFEAIVSVTAHRRRSFVWRSLDELIMRLGPAAIEASRTDVHATAARLFRDPAARAAP
jgi:hypothetical protein